MNPGELRASLIISWLVVTALTVPAVAAPFLLPPDAVFAAAPACEWKTRYGRECAVCGMTTAFVRIAEGDLAGATKANRGSIPLFAGFLANQFLGVAFGVRTLRGATSRSVIRRVLCKS